MHAFSPGLRMFCYMQFVLPAVLALACASWSMSWHSNLAPPCIWRLRFTLRPEESRLVARYCVRPRLRAALHGGALSICALLCAFVTRVYFQVGEAGSIAGITQQRRTACILLALGK